VKHQVQLAQDLASLPQFLCRQDDIVLVPRRPSVQFLGGIKRAGFALPEFVEMKEGRIDSKSPLMQRKLATLRPWAWGPDSVELLLPLFGNVTGEDRTAEQRFNTATARLYSKTWSAELLGNFLDRSESAPWLCTRNEVGVAASNPGDVLKIVAEIRKRGYRGKELKGQMWRLPGEIVAPYALADIKLTRRLRAFYEPHLERWRLTGLCAERNEYRLALTRMELRG
jgi:hypothetical protein